MTDGKSEITTALNVAGEKTQVTVIPEKEFTLEREQISSFKAVGLCFCFLLMDTGKQLSFYALRYYNHDTYPIPQTALVTIIELIKCVIMFFAVCKDELKDSLNLSLIYAVPSFLYSITNNIYFLALRFTTPPVWLVLTQSRVIITALVYRYIFKSAISVIQWVALLLIMISIILSQIPDGFSTVIDSNIIVATGLSIIASCLSVAASVYIEVLLKTSKISFSQIQFQFYFYGFLISLGFFVWEYFLYNVPSNKSLSTLLSIILVAGLFLGAAVGISSAFILKSLDNIVRIYSSAIANICTSICSSFLFPDRFSLNVIFIFALILLFFAIWLFEKKSLDNLQTSWKDCTNYLSNIPGSKIKIVFFLFTFCCLSFVIYANSFLFHLSFTEFINYLTS